MSNLLSSGVMTALISADSYSKTATKPMNMASRELKKDNPDMELVNRSMSYGTKELDKADNATESAQEELKKAQAVASAEKKYEDAVRLEEAKQENKLENAQQSEAVSSTATTTNSEVVVSDGSATQTVKTDSVEISAEVKIQLANSNPTPVSVDVPKIYSPTNAPTTMDIAPAVPQLDVRV